MVEEDPDPPISRGTVLGDKYRILELIGQGGMGRVYVAEHVYLHRRVALKLLRRDTDPDAETIARFEQEARTASRIGHPSIVEVVDFARLPDGNVFLAMELLSGQSLEDWMAGTGRLVQALRWMADVARGLHAAHEAGVVHRDVKPANIFLQAHDDGTVTAKILDFGIAKLMRSEA
jgi:serine/threonine protein kinase